MVGILFFDLDDFKPINDNYGHQVGDVVLKEISKRLKDILRPMDVLARFGGDEFVAAVYDVHSELELANIKERLINGALKPIAMNELELKIGVSVGSSIYPIQTDDLEELLKLADKDMYYQKRNKKAKR
ncbi:MAG TPA: GGDEF domain-containing protein [Fibrobacteraceae bacterium]|nr:GGDEF domain-containing protein [Fibrobacteraceae bacterium]